MNYENPSPTQEVEESVERSSLAQEESKDERCSTCEDERSSTSEMEVEEASSSSFEREEWPLTSKSQFQPLKSKSMSLPLIESCRRKMHYPSKHYEPNTKTISNTINKNQIICIKCRKREHYKNMCPSFIKGKGPSGN